MAGVQDICGWRLEIVTGWDEVTEFKVVSKGWTVEPTLAGLDRYCRWSKNSKIWLAQVKIWFILLWYNSCWSELPSTQLRAFRHSLRACLINRVDTDSPMYPISETISIYSYIIILIYEYIDTWIYAYSNTLIYCYMILNNSVHYYIIFIDLGGSRKHILLATPNHII